MITAIRVCQAPAGTVVSEVSDGPDGAPVRR
jgi:hypothetical protein